MRRHQWRPQLTRSELYRGWVFFAVYVVVFPILMGQIQRLASRQDVYFPVAEANVVYYALSALLLLLLLWSYLKNGFFLLLDWLPENLFAFCTGLFGFFVLSLLVRLIPLPLENPIFMDYPQQFALSPAATVVLVVVLIPLVEEPLFRGLLFGSVRRYSRPLAYLLSVLCFSFYCVYQWAVSYGDPRYLLLLVRYLPMAAAFTWCYDNGGSIWSAIALHMAVSGVTLLATLS